MTQMAVDLLGRFEIRRNGEPVSLGSRRTEALFAYLAYTGVEHSREHLADLLWNASTPVKAAGNLRVLLTNLRRNTGDCVEITRHSVLFRPSPSCHVTLDLDVARRYAERALKKAVRALTADDVEGLEAAAALCRGPLLDRLEVADCPSFDDWLYVERATVQQFHVQLLGHLVAGQLAHGREESAVQSAARLVTADPLSEASHRTLIWARLEAGDTDGARRQYDVLERMLRTEHDVAPSQETRALLDRLSRRGLVVTAPRSPSLARARSDARDRAPWSRFVGRQEELVTVVQAYTEVLQGRGAVVVVRGEGGSGKSMLLRQSAQHLLRHDASVAVIGASCGGSPAVAGASLFLAHVLGQLDGDTSGPWLGASMPPAVAERVAELGQMQDWPNPRVVSDAARLVTSVRHLATVRPVALFVDDLHWADDTALQVLADLAQDLRTKPILLLVGVRSDGADGRGCGPTNASRLLARIARGRNDLYVDLDSPAAHPVDFVEALLASERHRLPDSFLRELADLSGGHPQTAVELLRDMARRQVLEADGRGRFTLRQAPDWTLVPERVARLLDERLYDLPAGHSAVVEAAAVCGSSFDVRAVASLCDRPLHDVIRVVSGPVGCRSRMFVPVSAESASGPVTHRFRHPLMHHHVRSTLDPVWHDHLRASMAGLPTTPLASLP